MSEKPPVEKAESRDVEIERAEIKMADALAEVLNNRGQSHGDFTDHARVTQELKAVLGEELVLRAARKQQQLNNCQREALEMIFHKIGRILAGNPNFEDHWTDIAGYAKIAADRPGAKG